MLVNNHTLAAAAFAAKDETRPVLSALNITPTHVVATDSYQLLEVALPEQTGETLDGIRNDAGTGLLPASAALHALKIIPQKQPLPLMENAFTSTDGDGKKMTLATTDLFSQKKVEAQLVEGTYPDYAAVFPDGQGVRVSLDARMLKTMADYFAKHGWGSQVLIEVYGPDKPIVFRGRTKGTEQKVRGLIMPQRTPEDSSPSSTQQ